MTKIQSEVQKLSGEGPISLYIIDTTPIGGSEIYRFTTLPDENDVAPVFDGQVYTPTDIEATGFKWDSKGAFPRPRVSISNVDGIITAAIISFGDLVGSKFYRIRTLPKHLDNGTDPDVTATFPLEVYTVNQRITHTKEEVTWELASSLDNAGVKIPRRQCFRNNCTHRYRVWNPVANAFDYSNATCPYTGQAKDENGNDTGNALDVCPRTLKGCRDRFGVNGELPTRAFPGIARVRR